MAGLLKAMEKGYKPLPREIIAELEELPLDTSYWCPSAANYGAATKEELLTKMLPLLKRAL